jgi:hypothetical protein
MCGVAESVISSRQPSLTTDAVKDFKDGYPNLATFISSDEDFAIYRRFGYLQARLLLDKQDQLRLLEEQLDAHDKTDIMRHTRKGLTAAQYEPRKRLLREIERVFTSYGASMPLIHPYAER